MYKPSLICGFLSRAFHFATKSSQLVAKSCEISISNTGTPSADVSIFSPAAFSHLAACFFWSFLQVAGESTPSAFFTGENSSPRAPSIMTGFLAMGRASKTNISNFIPFGLSGFTCVPESSTNGIFLSARWKGSLAPPDEPPSYSTKLRSSICIATLPARNSSWPFLSRRS